MTETMHISNLKGWDKNPRGIKKDAFERLKRQITAHGQFKPVLVTADGEVIGGNMRLKAYQALGITDIWVSVVTPKDETEKIAIALADNDRAGYYEEDALAELIMSVPDLVLEDYHLDLGKTISAKDLLDKFRPTEEDDFDVEAELPEEAVSKLGDVYQLGNHRLMCGDSTNQSDVGKLMQSIKNEKYTLFTDPPYGVDYDPNWLSAMNRAKGTQNNKADSGMMNDSPNDLDLSILFTFERRFIWGFPYLQDNNATGWVVWDKQPGVNWRTMTTPVEIASTTLRKGFDLFHCMWAGFMRDKQDGEERTDHPTQKPLKLICGCISRFVKDNNIIDLFGGSGSTLIACEQLDRSCYMMELDPKYCDVIIKRWEQFTGEKAIQLTP